MHSQEQILDLCEQIEIACSTVRSTLAQRPAAGEDFLKRLIKVASEANRMLRKDEASQLLNQTQQEQANRDWTNFTSSQGVVDFCQAKNLTLPHKQGWWMVPKQPFGTISGLEKSTKATGHARITNGIDIWLECADGTLFKGHRDWFVAHKAEKETKEQVKEKQSEQVEKQLAEQYGFLLK